MSFDQKTPPTEEKTNAREALLTIDDVSVTYQMEESADVQAVRDVSFSIKEGETFGIVGESGCGKTTIANAILKLLDDNGEITTGNVTLDGQDLSGMSEAEMRAIRWDEVATIPQNVMNSLNPVVTVGDQIVDVVQLHRNSSEEDARAHVADLFDRVGIDPNRMDDYPHEFSGGMLQRAVIAMAISCDPKMIIADEPTTALDVVVQKQILDELSEIQEEMGLSLLVISHDIGVMSEICDRLGVMYAGELMEIGTTEDIINNSSNPYTLGLKNSFPDIDNPDRDLVGIPGTAPDLSGERTGCVFRDRCPFADATCEVDPGLRTVADDDSHQSRCHFVDEMSEIRSAATDAKTWTGEETERRTYDLDPNADTLVEGRNVTKHFDTNPGLVDTLLRRDHEPVRAVDGVDLEIKEGEVFGVVGESGCGKTTLGRLLMNLIELTEGEIDFGGRSVSSLSRAESQEFRRDAQIIFQDPFESFNPRLTIQQALMEPITLLGESLSYSERLERVEEVLRDVNLEPPEDYLERLPNQLSGGELQRVAIARALIVEPSFILADEPVSMLDVSIRANVLNVLQRLRAEHGLTYAVISHDISLVRNIATRAAVMYLGEFVEYGPTDAVVDDPKHPYTEALVESVPHPDPTRKSSAVEIEDETPSARNPPSGCRFHTRCPEVIPPEDMDIAQERFREIMDLRQDLAERTVHLEGARRKVDSEDPERVADELKSRYFGGSFRDSSVETAVTEALHAAATGDFETATTTLAETFRSPCEMEAPELREIDDGRYVACHLY
jgi:peptide/nickel transport system ATP-binding protein